MDVEVSTAGQRVSERNSRFVQLTSAQTQRTPQRQNWNPVIGRDSEKVAEPRS